MSWTYFTSYLDGTRPITKNERDELYTQLAAKFTGCSAGNSLNATIQSAITGSGLTTDLASVTVPIYGSSTGRLKDILDLTSTYGAWSNYSTAVTSALSTASLTSTERDAIITAGLDSYKLWNYYRALIDGLTTLAATAPTLVCRTASASLTKCGFEEFGTPSSPPKIYRTRTYSGTFTDTTQGGGGVTNSYSGAENYSRPDCSYTDSTALAVNDSNSGCSGTINQWASDIAPDSGHPWSWSYSMFEVNCPPSTYFRVECSSPDFITDTSTTVQTWTMPGGSACYPNTTGTVTRTLSNEYTTTQLNDDVDAAIPAFSGSYSEGTCSGAYRNLTTDELTLTKRGMQYKFTLPDLSGFVIPGGYINYKVEWVERFTPAGGGSPTDTAKCYQWDGSATETGVYTINPPSTNGTTTVVSVVASCGSC